MTLVFYGSIVHSLLIQKGKAFQFGILKFIINLQLWMIQFPLNLSGTLCS